MIKMLLFIGLFLGSLSAIAAELDLNAEGRPALDKQRDVTSKPQAIIDFSGVKPGMKVLDLFGGGGYYSELISQVVGDKGEVYLHSNKAYKTYIEKERQDRQIEKRFNNIVIHEREAGNLELPENYFDEVFMVMTYHDFFFQNDGWDVDVKVVMPQVIKSLKPGGRVLIVDHRAQKGAGISVVEKLHRIDPEFVKKNMQEWGFKFIKESDVLQNPNDPLDIHMGAKDIRKRTDRFVFLFEKI